MSGYLLYMVQEELTVTNPKGIHARPSALIVSTATECNAHITITYNGETVDADDIMGVLSLGAEHGRTLTISATGPQEEHAIARMKEIFALNFNDD